MPHEPVQLNATNVQGLTLSGSSRLHLGGIWGHVESGQTWLATDGRRTVLFVDSMWVVYVLSASTHPARNNRIFRQSATGFRGEVTTYPFVEAARRAAPVARLAELQMQVMVGLLAATSGAGFAAVLGADLLEFCLKHRDDFGKWSKAVAACLSVRDVLKRHAPTLYDKLIEAVVLSAGAAVTDALRNVPAAALNDPKISGRLVGTLLGKLGTAAVSSRLGALAASWIVLSTVATKAASAVPAAMRVSMDERARSAEAIVWALQRAGVVLSAVDARKIVEEVAARPQELRQSLQQLREAFDGITAE